MTAADDELRALRGRCQRQAANIRQMQLALERKNRELDALHMVWCDGGCPGGVHRWQGGEVLVTEELVQLAEQNTARLRHWYNTVKMRYPAWLTASTWHSQYATRAAQRTDLMERCTDA